jgi:hypothetical protein
MQVPYPFDAAPNVDATAAAGGVRVNPHSEYQET